MDCIFCKIVNKEIPAQIVYEDENILAFNDIDAQAPVHVLIIPKKHISDVLSFEKEDVELLQDLLKAVKTIAQEKGLQGDGFRIVNNCGEKGGQTVGHFHIHLLGGRQMNWPPG